MRATTCSPSRIIWFTPSCNSLALDTSESRILVKSSMVASVWSPRDSTRSVSSKRSRPCLSANPRNPVKAPALTRAIGNIHPNYHGSIRKLFQDITEVISDKSYDLFGQIPNLCGKVPQCYRRDPKFSQKASTRREDSKATL